MYCLYSVFLIAPQAIDDSHRAIFQITAIISCYRIFWRIQLNQQWLELDRLVFQLNA